MISLTLPQLQLLAPNIRSNYRAAFAAADTVLTIYGINANGLRLAHFMAQVLHETGGLTIHSENMNYRAERIVAVWPARFADVEAARPFAHNPEKLANQVYGGRMGNLQPGDGFRFIGRGLLQITGREAYERHGRSLGIDLAGNPALALDPQWLLKIAAEEWKASNCNALADVDSLRRVTKAINGGLIGLSDRQDWLGKTKQVWVR